MSSKYNDTTESNEDKLRKIDEFFSQFEEKETKSKDSNLDDFLSRFNDMNKKEQSDREEYEKRRQTRMDRLNEKKNKTKSTPFSRRSKAEKNSNEKNTKETNTKAKIVKEKPTKTAPDFYSDTTSDITKDTGNKKPKKKKSRGGLNLKKVIIILFCLCLLGVGVLGAFTVSIIADAPDIDPSKIYTLLSESSTLYDDEGNVIDNLTMFSAEGSRTNVEYNDIPKNLTNAFVALEDKTFYDHHGFNIIRIFGAIKDSFTTGKISGTSTITQQLSRNLYLSESKSERSLTRKVREAYYTVLLEKHLAKEEILEAYLNTIYLGYNSYGIQAASQAYFSKDIGDLTLAECAALAALPPAPNSYAWIKKLYPEDVPNPNDENILLKSDEFFYVYNDTAEKRRLMCLDFMLEQGMISKAEHKEAKAQSMRDLLHPSVDLGSEISSYFADYVVEEVIQALMDECGKTEEEAEQMVYSGGLQIHTTMDSDMQKIVENEFSQNSNFPSVTNLNKDGSGNIVNAAGSVILYNHSNYFQSDGNFALKAGEFKHNSDGSLTIYRGKRLNIYKTKVQDTVDYNLEFKNMYVVEDGVFYSMEGGVVSIPAEYKTRDNDGNLIIAASFFEDMPEVIKFSGDNAIISNEYFTTRQKVVQPQSAMVITDPYTGEIKAMVGGRNTVGRLLFNRATSTRQPGSSIKPIGVYAPALQASVNALNEGKKLHFSDDTGVASLMGDYFTAASVIDDTPLTIQGKQWPKNWYNSYRGLYTFRTSIEQSVNVNAVRVFQQVGVASSVSFLKDLGVSTIVETGETNDLNSAALALGGMTNGISPLEMSAAYAAFVNDGKYTEPCVFTKVTNKRGEVLLENTAKSEQVMDPGVAFIMRDMLRSTVTAGLGSGASIPNQPVAGKTGTTTDNYDAWFVGFTPQYSAAVWIGNDVNIELSSGGPAAARLWSKVMTKVCAGIPTGSYAAAPSNVISVTIDTKSGKLPSSLSSLDPRGTVRSEYFIKGTQPTTTDNVHKYVTVCSETGYLSTPSCPSTKSVLGVMRPYRVNPVVGDIGYEVPHYYCSLHNSNPSEYQTDPNGGGSYNFESADTQEPTTPSTGNEGSTENGGTVNEGSNSNSGTGGNNSTPAPTPDTNSGAGENPNEAPPEWLQNQ